MTSSAAVAAPFPALALVLPCSLFAKAYEAALRLSRLFKDLILGEIKDVFQDYAALLFMNHDNRQLIKNALEKAKPQSNDEGTWPTDLCK